MARFSTRSTTDSDNLRPPITVRRIQLHFLEPLLERTQEFSVRWSSAEGGPPKEIIRQQWNFSPTGSTREVEDYEVSLDDVAVLELAITPDLTRGEAPATLAKWRVARSNLASR